MKCRFRIPCRVSGLNGLVFKAEKRTNRENLMDQLQLKRHYFFPVTLIGFSATISQIIFLRELMVIFTGNELSIAIVLGCWLFWTSIGSGVTDRLFPTQKHPETVLGIIQLLLFMILPASLLFMRSSFVVFHRVPGEILGLLPIIWISLLVTLPFCLLSGWAFSLASRMLSVVQTSHSRAINLVYQNEALGATAGGFLVSLILLKFWNGTFILFSVALLNFYSGLFLISGHRKSTVKAIFLFAISLFVTGFMIRAAEPFQHNSLQFFWRDQKILASKDTFYGNVTVTKSENQTNFFESGLLSFSVPDPLGAEEATQFALLEHPDPKRILLIGGGMGGRLTEILQTPSVQLIDYVELNPAVITLGEAFLPSQKPSFSNPRVHIFNQDARLFLAKTTRRYDVIVSDMPPPYTAQLNRLYTIEFFREAARHLKKGGIFSFGLPGSENFIGDDLARYLATFQKTLRDVFAEVLVLPGNKIHFVATNERHLLTSDPTILIRRMRQRHLKTLYISPYYLPFRLSPERKESLLKRLQTIKLPRRFQVNRDFRPVAYFYDNLLWSTYFYQGTRNLFRQLVSVPVWIYFVFPILIYLILTGILATSKQQKIGLRIGVSIVTIGFTEIALEILFILGFQIIYGYAYYLLSIIITLFMGGLAGGSWLARQKGPQAKKPYRLFAWIQFGMAVLPLLYGFFLAATHTVSHSGFTDGVIILFFGIFTVLAGFLAGFQFPLGNFLYLSGTSASSQNNWGTLYALDLSGSILGALLVAAILTPLLGLPTTLLFLSVLNALAWVTLKA